MIASTSHIPRTVLWWGRFDSNYSRNRILRQCFTELGWHLKDFRPRLSFAGDIEANLRGVGRSDLVWVPCFRQRDIAAASRWARRQGIPLIFDPLISAYDKQVFERGKFSENSVEAQRLLRKEQRQFALADAILTDTGAHAAFFREVLKVNAEKLRVVAVGAEDGLFTPQTPPDETALLELLFFGSFIPLQGPEIIVEAARIYRGPPLRWTLVGNGPLRNACEQHAQGVAHIRFEDWLPYKALPARIQRASCVLGIFGATPKAQRVIPNKVYQALACARPVITLKSAAYPPALLAEADSGIYWIDAGNAHALADKAAEIATARAELKMAGNQARRSYESYFSHDIIRAQLCTAIEAVTLPPAPG